MRHPQNDTLHKSLISEVSPEEQDDEDQLDEDDEEDMTEIRNIMHPWGGEYLEDIENDDGYPDARSIDEDNENVIMEVGEGRNSVVMGDAVPALVPLLHSERQDTAAAMGHDSQCDGDPQPADDVVGGDHGYGSDDIVG